MQDADYTGRTIILQGGPALDGTGHSIPDGPLPDSVTVDGVIYRLSPGTLRWTPTYRSGTP